MTVPVQEVYIGDLRLAYRVTGAGPEVLLIHGWMSSSRMWELLTMALAARFRCWAIDLPGFADSAKPASAWYSMENYGQVLERFVDHMGLKEFDLVGHSMGGMLALRMAALQPRRVRRLVAINPVVTGRVYLDLKLLAKTPWTRPMLALGKWFWPLASSDLWHGPRAGYGRRMSEEWKQATPESALAAAQAIGHYDLTPLLPQIVAPTLVIVGKHDLAAPNAEGRWAAKLIPRARLEVLAAGHLPTDDVPEQVHQLVMEFLQVERCARPSSPVSV